LYVISINVNTIWNCYPHWDECGSVIHQCFYVNGLLHRTDDGPCFAQECYLHKERAPTLDKDKEIY